MPETKVSDSSSSNRIKSSSEKKEEIIVSDDNQKMSYLSLIWLFLCGLVFKLFRKPTYEKHASLQGNSESDGDGNKKEEGLGSFEDSSVLQNPSYGKHTSKLQRSEIESESDIEYEDKLAGPNAPATAPRRLRLSISEDEDWLADPNAPVSRSLAGSISGSGIKKSLQRKLIKNLVKTNAADQEYNKNK